MSQDGILAALERNGPLDRNGIAKLVYPDRINTSSGDISRQLRSLKLKKEVGVVRDPVTKKNMWFRIKNTYEPCAVDLRVRA